MTKESTKYGSCFSITISICLGFATLLNILISFFRPLFVLNENQLLYLFSAMAQIIGGVFGLTLTAYVFFVDKFKESAKDDETYYDATAALLNRYFRILIVIAISCGLTIFFCIAGIIILHNWTVVYPFVINESVVLFVISVTSILLFGTMLLDPGKLDREIAKMKKKAEEFYQTIDATASGDFIVFLKSYNLLEHIIIDFAEECMKNQSDYRNNYKPRIIQSLKVLGYNQIINSLLQGEINEFRMYRNALVHGIDFFVPQKVCVRISEIYQALQKAFDVYKKSGKDSEEWNTAIRKVYDLTRQDSNSFHL